MKKRFTEEQIIGFLREAEAGMPIAELCRKHAFSEAIYYLWRSKFGGMNVSDAKRLKELELENEVTKEALRKKWFVGMSPTALPYRPAEDRNVDLKAKIITLAQHHRCYGAGMIYLKLRQAGEVVNHKRVDRLHTEAGLQVRRCKRKKIPAADRHPLERPLVANHMWSMDFVFDRTVEGRVIKSLTVVDDATNA